jgi:hypothetical protein
MARSAELCRLRYKDFVSIEDKRRSGPWTEEEIVELFHVVLELLEETDWTEDMGMGLDVIKQYIDWTAVGARMGCRGRLQCRVKWETHYVWKGLMD